MAQPLEHLTSENEATYDSLISLIENNQERLALILVACDDLRLRQRVIDRYESEARQAKIRPFRIVLGTEPSLRAGLAKLELRQGDAAVVTVTGAEWLLRVAMRQGEEQSDLDKFFGYLQWTREGLREFRYPLVLWVTHRILREMRRRAPDFWSWRKAVLRFASEETETIAVRAGERQLESPQPWSNEEFLPPLEELLSEIQQLESTSPESANLATLYDKLGQVYGDRIARGEATHLEQERQQAIDAFQNSIHRYQALNNQSDLVDVLQRFGSFLYAQSRYKEVIAACQQSLEIAREIGDRRGEMGSLSNLGLTYSSLGQYTRAIELYQQSLEIAREIGDRRGEAASLGNLGLTYSWLGLYEQAIDFQQQSLEIAREIGNRRYEANSLIDLGNGYCLLGQYTRAIELYQQSLEIAREIDDRGCEANSLGNSGSAYHSLGQYERAIDFQQQSLEIKREIGDLDGEASSLNSLGNIYDSLEQYERAIELYQQSSEIFREVGNRHYEAIAVSNKAQLLAKYEPRRFEALAAFQQARAIYTKLKLDHMVEQCDEDIHDFNQIVATEQRQSAPAIPLKPKSRAIKKRQTKWVLWFCVGLAIVLLIAWLRK